MLIRPIYVFFFGLGLYKRFVSVIPCVPYVKLKLEGEVLRVIL